ncbi:ketohexokinase [Aplysia californica]|uniref:Ketohexokinase n=1 Tax=Aplysia californica TaxID=6500 RepID=A0ABM1AA71_APLCA|nr:ketohexokinase [Aplysia californica]XP_012943798.1 ketohexokinase [Aplysia californica]XP_035828440.1 ketohexokinase [Aplysia californica]
MATPLEKEVGKVLCVGLACVDFVNVIGQFPQEDSDQRGLKYYWQRGGNAANNSTVLSLLAVPVEFMGVLGNAGAEACWIQEDFSAMGIDTSHCVMESCLCPVSTCILCQTTGSRTILHYPRDQPKLTYRAFHEKLKRNFSAYAQVHFELGSNVQDYELMMEDVLSYNTSLGTSLKQPVVISLEIEKPDISNSEAVMSKADIVFISKDFASIQGFEDPVSAVKGLYNHCHKGAVLICAWAELGAAAKFKDEVLTASALTGVNAVDTLGAGDTFVAGFIGHALKKRKSSGLDSSIIRDSLEFGCQLAGRKCSMYGYNGLKEFW